jgi:hypothetical protein
MSGSHRGCVKTLENEGWWDSTSDEVELESEIICFGVCDGPLRRG